MKKITTVIIVLILILGGFYFYQRTESEPEEEVVRGIMNLTELDSVSVSGESEGKFEDFSGNVVHFDSSGSVDIEFLDSFRGDLRMELSDDDREEIIEGSTIYAENNLYLKYEEGDSAPVDDEFGEEYILLEEDLFLEKELTDEIFGDLRVERREFLAALKEAGREERSLKEVLANIFEKTWEKEFLEVVETERNKLNGRRVRKHVVEINPENFGDFVDSTIEEYNEVLEILATVPEEERMEDVEEFKEDFQNNLVDEIEMESFYLHLWTGDKYLEKLEFGFEGEFEEDYISIDQKIRLKNFGEEFKIEAPEEVTEERLPLIF